MKANGRRKPQRIPEILSTDEQQQLLAQLNDESPSSIRGRAILRVFLDCGLRAAELINLRHSDVNLDTGRLWVRNGKGGKDRGLWINGEALATLQAWLAYKGVKLQCGANFLPHGHLFTALDGIKPICARWMGKMVKRLGEKAGIEKNCHPHLFRHCFATRLLQHSKNLFLVSRALGHADISSTQVYLHLCDHELQEALRGMNSIS